jgi:outer membrane murein-binding lipoprotein Lpp
MSLRLRASRQEKLSISAEALNVLQDELREEDDRFKEAVKAAEDSAILAEVGIFQYQHLVHVPNILHHCLT